MRKLPSDHVEAFSKKLIAAVFDVKYGPRWQISDEEVWATHGL
jgi:hypothetical protein